MADPAATSEVTAAFGVGAVLPMKIAVVTPGRFHSFDMAAQLEARGVLGRIFTGYPPFKLKRESVPREKMRCIWPLYTLAMASQRLPFKSAIPAELFRAACDRVDRVAARQLDDCDGVIALSGTGTVCGPAMKRRGGFWVCDRGSTHILFQDRILREEAEIVGLPPRRIDPRTIDRELGEYAAADAIFVPSDFVRLTFLEQGVAPEKVKLAPYGVNTAAFRPSGPKAERFTVLFAGQVNYRKGVHHLLKAWREWAPKTAELRIAGGADQNLQALIDRAGGLPENCVFLGHLDRATLVQEMSRAHALVLPSIEEGLALVMGQAMACGTPVIASRNTGAQTLFTDGVEGFIGPARSPDFLAEAFERLAADPALAQAMGQAALQRAKTFGGADAYGDRIMAAVREIVGDGLGGATRSP